MSVQYKLTDEVTDLNITAEFDPFLKNKYEEYIHITEKPNLGRVDYFNNMPDVETRDVHISGLVLKWQKNLSESKLGSVLDRKNIENLYMYADTVFIYRHLHFPQTNVFIYARRVIFSADARLITTPEKFEQNIASGGSEEEGMKNGLSGNSAGNIKIFSKNIILKNKKDSIVKIESSEIVKGKTTNASNVEYIRPTFKKKWRMYDGEIDIKWKANKPGPLYLVFLEDIPKDGIVNLDKNQPYIKISVPDISIRKKSFQVLINLVGNTPTVSLPGMPIGKKYKIAKIENAAKFKNFKPFYVGVFVDTNAHYPFTEMKLSNTFNPYFELNGSDGQGGEKGGLPANIDEVEVAAGKNTPISWDYFLNEVLSFDTWRGDGKSWEWPHEVFEMMQNKVYYAEALVFNLDTKTITVGDKDMPNKKNGLDAYPSGAGGNGGDGGVLEIIENAEIENNDESIDNTVRKIPLSKLKSIAEAERGDGGKSEFRKGGKKADDVTYYHMKYFIFHKGLLSSFPDDLKSKYKKLFPGETITAWKPKGLITKELKSQDGKDANGKPGKIGKSGSVNKLKADGYQWMHPFILETIAQFTRDEFLAGDRRPARWLIPMYMESIKQLKPETLNYLSRNILNEMKLIGRQAEKNLDYFGNPVGWIPKLSALTNLDILKKSKAAIVKSLYYADKLDKENQNSKKASDQLKFISKQLNAEIKTANDKFEKAYEELEKVKEDLYEINDKIADKMVLVLNFKEKSKNLVRQQEQEQAIWKGSWQLLGAACQFIPFGQPYLGSIGGGLSEEMSKVKIHGDNLLVQGFETAGNFGNKLGTFIDDNKKELKGNIDSAINEGIDNSQSAINNLDSDIKEYKSDLEDIEKEFNESDHGAELRYWNKMLNLSESVSTMAEAEYLQSDEVVDIINNMEEIKGNIEQVKDIGNNNEEKQEILGYINDLENEKKSEIKSIKEFNEKKKKKKESLEKTAQTLERVGKGISGVSEGLTAWFKPLDEESQDFLDQVATIENKQFKKEFDKLYKDLEEFNAWKLKVVEKLFKYENIIDSSCQTISDNLVKVSVFNDQRAELSQRQLSPLTQQFLKNIKRNLHELLLSEIYFLLKAYQYRFVKKIDTELYDIQKLINDINKNLSNNNKEIPGEKEFKNAFDFVIKSKLLEMAKDLLTTDLQVAGSIKNLKHIVTINEKTKTKDGINLLEELNKEGEVSFKLHELAGNARKGSGNWRYYKIADIKFTDIKVSIPRDLIKKNKKAEDDLSINFGIRHSGESVIRNDKGEYYYFTSIGPDGSDTNIKKWEAEYNGAKRKNANRGISNESISRTNQEILSRLLIDGNSGSSKTDIIKYTDHLPGATSELTLYVDKKDKRFSVDQLTFNFHYEAKT